MRDRGRYEYVAHVHISPGKTAEMFGEIDGQTYAQAFQSMMERVREHYPPPAMVTRHRLTLLTPQQGTQDTPSASKALLPAPASPAVVAPPSLTTLNVSTDRFTGASAYPSTNEATDNYDIHNRSTNHSVN